jgi:hypothetical protein
VATYATTAAQGPANGNTNWQQAPPKKKAATHPPENSFSNRQLVLTQDIHVNPLTINSLDLRNRFNTAFANKGVLTPVVASVKASKRDNIVLTTTPSFNAKYLLEKAEIWNQLTPFKEALPIQPWFKVAIHNIPTSLFRNEDLKILKDEIPIFNNGLQIVGNPYWLTKEERREEQISGSVCIAFSTEQEAH